MALQEVLVVLTGEGEPPFPTAAVTHRCSARVVVARLEQRLLGDVAADPRVRYAGTRPPADVLTALSEGERLFVSGWQARVEQPKARPEQRLSSWDAPGRTPPDLPGGARPAPE